MSRPPSVTPNRRNGSSPRSDRQAPVQRRLEDVIAGLGERDRRAVVLVVKRVAEVAEKDGQAAALRLVEEIIRIITSPETEQ